MDIAKKNRILGIDLGERRTGIAISDLTGTLAGGLVTIQSSGLRDTAAQVSELALKHGVSVIVIGKPLNMNGTLGESGERALKFAEILGGTGDFEIILFDERLTTSLAHVYMNQTGTRSRKRKAAVDMLSAQILLQNFIDSRKI